MEVKKIVEGMTAVEVAEVIDSNFREIKEETDAKISELGSEKYYNASGSGAKSLFSLEKHRGEKVAVKVTGNYQQYGYYFGTKGEYKILDYYPNEITAFDVPLDATSFFVYHQLGTDNSETTFYTGLYADTVNLNKKFTDLKSVLQKFAFVGNNVKMTIDFDSHTYSVPSVYYNLMQKGYGNVVAENNKPIVPRSNGQYSGMWILMLDSSNRKVEFFFFDNMPDDLTNLYTIAFGVDNTIIFSTSSNFIEISSIEKIKESMGYPLFRNKVPGYEDVDELINSDGFSSLKRQVESVGGYVSKYTTVDNEFIRINIPSGTSIGSAWSKYAIGSFSTVVGDDGKAKCYFKAMLRNTENFKGFSILTNGSWSNPNTIIKAKPDDKFHSVSAYAEIEGIKGTAVSFNISFFLTRNSPENYAENLTVDLYNIAFSDKPIGLVGSYQYTKLSDNGNINDISEILLNAKGCVFMCLGDSITTESYYVPKLRQILQPSKYYNLAVSSATWADRAGTNSYDGNPQFTGDQNQNVIGNQLQKILDNPNIYNVAPDIIIISAGTNDGQPIEVNASYSNIVSDIDSHFIENNSVIPISSPTFDSSDTYMKHRKTMAGSMRYVVCKLQMMYPNARIYILTPIQGCYSSRDYASSIQSKQLYITEVAKHLGVPVIHVGEECGITADFEYQGAMWTAPSGSNEKSGRDLVDGLHPNTNGSWKMAKYIAKRILNDYMEIPSKQESL